jgi:uncharacterized protein YqfB (UPF0267 family)
MAEKTFINDSFATLQITLFVRVGDNPIHEDGTVSFSLNPEETKIITYGNDQNILLNGIKFFTTFEEDLFSEFRSVTLRDSDLDNLLNLNNVLTIKKVQTDYVISGSNISLDDVNAEETTAEIQADLKAANDNATISDHGTLKQRRTIWNLFRKS